jgi:metal-dependent amidase/aminoacylase/carboxypeptidase family protein
MHSIVRLQNVNAVPTMRDDMLEQLIVLRAETDTIFSQLGAPFCSRVSEMAHLCPFNCSLFFAFSCDGNGGAAC